MIDQPVTDAWLRSIGGVEQVAPAGNTYFQFIVLEEAITVGPGTVYPNEKAGGLDIIYANVHAMHDGSAEIELYFDDFRDKEDCVPLCGRRYLDCAQVLALLDAVGAKYKEVP